MKMMILSTNEQKLIKEALESYNETLTQLFGLKIDTKDYADIEEIDQNLFEIEALLERIK